MSERNPIYEYNDESHADRLARKSKDSPFMIIGLAGMVAACVYGYRNFKKRGAMSTSVYLMQLRVAAQGTVVGALTLGLAYSLVKEHILKEKKEE